MSSKPAKATADTRKIGEYETAPLGKGQRARLHMLGWKDADLVEFTVIEALAILESRSAKPGSKAFLKANASKLAAAGIPPPAGLNKHSNEEIESRNASRSEASGVEVTRDEFTNQCLQAGTEQFVMDEYKGRVITGSDPLNAMLLEMEEKYCVYEDGFVNGKRTKVRIPTRRFRWTHSGDPAEVGPAPEPVYDAKTGKQVQNGELLMVWMPVDVWEEGRQKPQLARSAAMTGRIEKNKSDVMQTTDETGPVIEGQFQFGRSEKNYAP